MKYNLWKVAKQFVCTAAITGMSLSPDGNLLATFCSIGAIKIWDVADNFRLLRKLRDNDEVQIDELQIIDRETAGCPDLPRDSAPSGRHSLRLVQVATGHSFLPGSHTADRMHSRPADFAAEAPSPQWFAKVGNDPW